MTGLEALARLEYGKEEEALVKLIEQDLVTLQFIRSVWLSNQINEKKTIEMITEMLFSGKGWHKNEG